MTDTICAWLSAPGQSLPVMAANGYEDAAGSRIPAQG